MDMVFTINAVFISFTVFIMTTLSIKKVMIPLPVELHGAIRSKAFKEWTTMTALILAACEWILDSQRVFVSSQPASISEPKDLVTDEADHSVPADVEDTPVSFWDMLWGDQSISDDSNVTKIVLTEDDLVTEESIAKEEAEALKKSKRKKKTLEKPYDPSKPEEMDGVRLRDESSEDGTSYHTLTEKMYNKRLADWQILDFKWNPITQSERYPNINVKPEASINEVNDESF